MALVVRSIVRYRGKCPIGRAICGPDAFQESASRAFVSLTTGTTNPSQSVSARSKFKQTPVNPSILKYIESIGVGIPTKSTRRRRRASKSNFLSLDEERERFQPIRRLPSTTPPPPFAAPSKDKDETESGKIIKRFPVKLLGSVGSSDEKFPRATVGLPEVAIAGRSNVGKSTLLNALLYESPTAQGDDSELSLPFRGRTRRRPTSRTAKLPRGLKAATSSKPGETRRLSFYQLSSKVENEKVSMLLVDLPGYGFAFASDEQARQWHSLMESYLLDRGKSLKRILFLVDSRHGMKSADIEFLDSLQRTMHEKKDGTSPKKRELPPIQIVLTKCDLVEQADLARRVAIVRQQVSDCLRRQPSALPIMLVSAQVEGQGGVLQLQKELASLVPTSSK